MTTTNTNTNMQGRDHDQAGPETASADAGISALVETIRQEIERQGRITFAEFMRIALYDPGHGYYQSPYRRPGRGGDFLTAPEVHPFFGIAIARQIAECWDRLGNAARLTVREHGAGIGGLAYDIIVGLLDRRPEIRSALRYELVEVNPHRAAQAMAAMREVGFGEIVRLFDPGPDATPPPAPITGVVLANEVADALPVHRLQWNGTGFEEVWVTWEAGRFVETSGALSAPVRELEIEHYLVHQGIDLAGWPIGARIEVSPAAAEWIAGIARGIARGYAIVIDYGYAASTLYRDHRLEGTVRGYYEHTVTDDPLIRVGAQDLTAHVDFTRLIEAAGREGMSPVGLVTQGDFLARIGLGDLLVELQRHPDLDAAEYYRAQAAVFRLIDPAGLGRFRVLALQKDVPDPAPLTGFTTPASGSGMLEMPGLPELMDD